MHLGEEAVFGGGAALMWGPVLIRNDDWGPGSAGEGGISLDGIWDMGFCTWV